MNYVSFWDAARYANWLSTGGTETGVYMLNGVATPAKSTISRETSAWNAGGYAITSRDEWYKAAYYKGGSTNAGYWNYATQSDSAPMATNTPNSGANQANYGQSYGSASSMTDVGSFTGSASAYGTYDQNGSVWEWIDVTRGGDNVGLSGGVFSDSANTLQSSYDAGDNWPWWHDYNRGFRISSLTAVPEPSTYGAMAVGALVLSVWGRRRRK